jgi:hypothetical protein
MMLTKRGLRAMIAELYDVVGKLESLREYLPEDESGARDELAAAVEAVQKARDLLRDVVDIPRRAK